MSFGNFMSGFIGAGGMDNIGKLGKGLKKGMTDDKGLFQGGSKGDLFGRIKDIFGGKGRKKDAARDFAKSFDPTDSQSVMEMQQKLNQAGANLKVDGIMGPKTLGAVRAMQAGGEASDVFSPVRPTAGGQGTYTMTPQMNPAQGPPQQGPILGPSPNPQDPYGFGTNASGEVYGGQIGPWAPPTN
tara:strand:+ start:2346 stop:2900 length:555 start_codon:yes stop_codon:yes gene_type:complete